MLLLSIILGVILWIIIGTLVLLMGKIIDYKKYKSYEFVPDLDVFVMVFWPINLLIIISLGYSEFINYIFLKICKVDNNIKVKNENVELSDIL